MFSEHYCQVPVSLPLLMSLAPGLRSTGRLTSKMISHVNRRLGASRPRLRAELQAVTVRDIVDDQQTTQVHDVTVEQQATQVHDLTDEQQNRPLRFMT